VAAQEVRGEQQGRPIQQTMGRIRRAVVSPASSPAVSVTTSLGRPGKGIPVFGSHYVSADYAEARAKLGYTYSSTAHYLRSDLEGAQCLALAVWKAVYLAPDAIFEETG